MENNNQKTVLEYLNEIKCPYVRQRAINNYDNELNGAFWYHGTIEGRIYWMHILDFIDSYDNITESESLQFEKYLPENYDGIKRDGKVQNQFTAADARKLTKELYKNDTDVSEILKFIEDSIKDKNDKFLIEINGSLINHDKVKKLRELGYIVERTGTGQIQMYVISY